MKQFEENVSLRVQSIADFFNNRISEGLEAYALEHSPQEVQKEHPGVEHRLFYLEQIHEIPVQLGGHKNFVVIDQGAAYNLDLFSGKDDEGCLVQGCNLERMVDTDTKAVLFSFANSMFGTRLELLPEDLMYAISMIRKSHCQENDWLVDEEKLSVQTTEAYNPETAGIPAEKIHEQDPLYKSFIEYCRNHS